MAIIDHIPQADSINEKTPCVFIASKNIDINGLPILKGSVVYCKGNFISVNLIPCFVLKDYNDAEKVSKCKYEDIRLTKKSLAVWHKNHFHCGIKPSVDYEFIKPEILHYNGFAFSSFAYEYDRNQHRLLYFISEGDFILNFNNKKITISGKNEISLSPNDDSCYVIPLDTLNYGGFAFRKICSIDKQGVFKGEIAQDTRVSLISNHPKDKLILPSGTMVEVKANGEVSTKLGNRTTGKFSVVIVDAVRCFTK